MNITNKGLVTLQENPFQAYRDPYTGRWIVVKTSEYVSSCTLNIKQV